MSRITMKNLHKILIVLEKSELLLFRTKFSDRKRVSCAATIKSAGSRKSLRHRKNNQTCRILIFIGVKLED